MKQEESETEKTTRIGSMLVATVYLGILGAVTAIGIGSNWAAICERVKRFFGKGPAL
jgi:hypothetical protein